MFSYVFQIDLLSIALWHLYWNLYLVLTVNVKNDLYNQYCLYTLI